MFDLTGKTALITGATGAIGAAIAQAFARQGATLAISAHHKNALEELQATLGRNVSILPCDLLDPAQAEQLVPQAEAALGKLDILVANAGIIRGNLTALLSDKDWDEVIDVDLTAAFRLSRAAARGMMRRRFGRIIGIGSLLGLTGLAGYASYSAAKAGMVGLIKSIAQEYARRGVTANCIAPGFIDAPMSGVTLNDERIGRIVARVPSGTLGTAADVAAAAVFIASDEAAYVNGQTLHVNGGAVML